MLALYLLSKAAEEGPDASLAWILLIVLGVFFLIIVIGWATSSMKQSQSKIRDEVQKSRDKK